MINGICNMELGLEDPSDADSESDASVCGSDVNSLVSSLLG